MSPDTPLPTKSTSCRLTRRPISAISMHLRGFPCEIRPPYDVTAGLKMAEGVSEAPERAGDAKY